MTTEIDAEGLAVCPFCGNAPVIRRTMQDYPADDVHPAGQYEAAVHVCCDTCGFELVEEYQSDAIAAWNCRAIACTSEAEPVAHPTQDGQSIARVGFEAWAKPRALDLTETLDAWGSRKYVHPHIQSLWDGWFASWLTLPTPASDDQVEAVTALLDAYDAETAKIPLGHENISRGRSTYNWRRSVVEELRALAAMGSTKPARPSHKPDHDQRGWQPK